MDQLQCTYSLIHFPARYTAIRNLLWDAGGLHIHIGSSASLLVYVR